MQILIFSNTCFKRISVNYLFSTIHFDLKHLGSKQENRLHSHLENIYFPTNCMNYLISVIINYHTIDFNEFSHTYLYHKYGTVHCIL